jgi:hypothetical protein
MNMQRHKSYFIRVTDVRLFNALYASAESKHMADQLRTARNAGHYELHTHHAGLWYELYLYGQLLAQAQGETIEAGETED